MPSSPHNFNVLETKAHLGSNLGLGSASTYIVGLNGLSQGTYLVGLGGRHYVGNYQIYFDNLGEATYLIGIGGLNYLPS